MEAKEAGKRSSSILTEAAGLSKLSEFQKQKQKGKLDKAVPTPTDNRKCGWCGQTGHGGRPNRQTRKLVCKAYNHVCETCSSIGHYGSTCRSKKKQEGEVGSLSDQVQTLGSSGTFCNLNTIRRKGRVQKAISHAAYDQFKGWYPSRPQGHPCLRVNAAICRDGYAQMGLMMPKMCDRTIETLCLPDTGAQLTICGIKFMHKLGIKKHELIPLSNGVSVANNAGLGLLGGAFIEFSGEDNNSQRRTSRQLCYVAEDIDNIYLSKSACEDLGLIGKDFPVIGDFINQSVNSLCNKSDKQYLVAQNICQKDDGDTCSCPPRQLPPKIPTELPFPATPEYREKLKDWIIEAYATSAFNQCEHQPLPLMKGSPPINLHIDPTAKPVAIHKARPVPIHWREQVKRELERDVKIGVLERVPIGEPTDWCSPMVICPKTNGDPRRTVDLQALNKVAVRQTHPAEAPFHQALAVPKNTIKTVLDAWQGYHSVPIAEEDRHFTTFLTPWGRFRYRTCPQGFIASGDGYNARYDHIVRDFENKTKCIDDTLLWSDSIEQSFFRTCEYLTLCSNAGIIFNKKKFQFGQEEVDFLGFRITMDSIKPSSEYLKAITEFPRPKDITGVRSWFGLIQQVAYAFSSSEVMLIFRKLLKPTTEFLWTQELQDCFEKSKEVIVEAVERGIKIYDPTRITALCTDWSKNGLGFMLVQKECTCEDITPICCFSGWTLVYAGSRFTSPAESRYAPIEGECLSAAWSL